MKSRISTIILTALAFCLLTVFASAQTKQPNLTGTWVMNTEKSKFEQGGPSGITIKFDHKDAALNETMMLVTGGGDRTMDLKYTTDGKEATQDLMGATGQSVVKWEGDTLSIEWKIEGGSFNRKVSLSSDGKTMTMVVKQTSPDGNSSTDTVVLEKQATK
ncbi:MAG: hypothetical protein ACKVZH_01190 [Blastocatellia bacterium]